MFYIHKILIEKQIRMNHCYEYLGLSISGDFSYLSGPPKFWTEPFRSKEYIIEGKDLQEVIIPGKIILVGDPGVGKTSFVHRYINRKFTGNYKWTVGGE